MSRFAASWVLMACLSALSAQARTVAYAIAIGNNSPPLRGNSGLPELRYADDDAVRYDAYFARFTHRHWLLSVLDVQTQRRHPQATAQARPPTLGVLRSVVKELTAQLKADLDRGDQAVLYLSYSGHGAQNADGTSFLTLADGELTRKILYDEILATLPATYVHLFVDACHAEGVVGSRGLFGKERDATVSKLSKAEVASVVESESLRRFPHVGVLMATTEDQESHEWSKLQSGIFTHEVLSGFSGAADVNGDQVIEYSEIQAFIVSANSEVKDPRALPKVISVPPSLNRRVPLVSLGQLQDVMFLKDDFSRLGHFHIELDDGERHLDAHLSGEAPVQLAIPAGRQAFVIAHDQEAELQGQAQETKRLSDLRFRERSVDARGSVETSFRTALFQASFGPTYYKGFADSAGVIKVPFSSPVELQGGPDSVRRPMAIAALGLGAGALVGSGVLGLLALQAKHDFDSTELQRTSEEAKQRYSTFGNAGLATAAGAVVLGISGWLLWQSSEPAKVSHSGSTRVVPVAWAEGAGVTVSGEF